MLHFFHLGFSCPNKTQIQMFIIVLDVLNSGNYADIAHITNIRLLVGIDILQLM